MDLFAISSFVCIVIIDNVYGRCCGGNGKAGDKFVRGCGGYVGGKSALSHYKDGFFGTPSVTTWERGTNQGNLGFQLRVRGSMASFIISGGLKFSLQKLCGNLKPITVVDMPTDYVKLKMENFGK